MTLAVWLGGDVGLQAQCNPIEGVMYRIPEDNFDRNFTKYGFVYSLKEFEIDYASVVEGRRPFIPRPIHDESSVINWMMIDHYGKVWQIDYWMVREEGRNIPKMSVFSVPAGQVKSLVICPDEADLELLTGFVMAKPDKQQISDFVFDKKLSMGKRLKWLNKNEIVERLNKEFPLEKDTGKSGPATTPAKA